MLIHVIAVLSLNFNKFGIPENGLTQVQIYDYRF